MRIFLYGLLIIIFNSCATMPENKIMDSNYELAQLTLQNFPEWDEFRLLAVPNNEMIDHYLDGFMLDTLDLRNYKFDFKSDRNAKWEYKNFSNQNILSKLSIIDDYSKVKTVDLNDYKSAKMFVKMSKPLYSGDNKYAVIYISSFFNLSTLSQSEGYTLIFSKENGKWTLISSMLTSVS